MTVLLLCAAILLAAGIAGVAYTLGRIDERTRAERRRPLAPHEVLARLRGPLPAPSRPDPSLTERVARWWPG